MAGYFFFLRPQQQKAKKARAVSKEVEVGDEILTVGGIVGRVVDVNDDRLTIVSGTDAQGIATLGTEPTRLVLVKAAIARKIEPVVPPSSDDDPPVSHDAPSEDRPPDDHDTTGDDSVIGGHRGREPAVDAHPGPSAALAGGQRGPRGRHRVGIAGRGDRRRVASSAWASTSTAAWPSSTSRPTRPARAI